MSLVDESLEFNSFLGGELVTVESESTTEIIHKYRLGDIYRSRYADYNILPLFQIQIEFEF